MIRYSSGTACPQLRSTSPWRMGDLLGLVIFCLAATGCGTRTDLNTEYGKRGGGWQSASINGTGLLAEMYEQTGARVSSWGRLSRRLASCDTIVWFPTDPTPPTVEQVNFFEDWLSASPNRTLVYVGPGYDARVQYWEAVRQQQTGADRIEAHRRLAESRLANMFSDGSQLVAPTSTWFQLTPLERPSHGGELGGQWSDALRGQPLDIRRWTRITWTNPDAAVEEIDPNGSVSSTSITASEPVAPDDPAVGEIDSDVAMDEVGATGHETPETLAASEVDSDNPEPDPHRALLTVSGDPFVWRYQPSRWNGSRLVVVTNASLLLNLPLTRPAHQRFAQLLVNESQGSSKVVFLETGPGGPAILESEELPLSGLAALADWPLGPILVQWLLVGTLFCLAVFPIFGRPRTPPESPPADFGEHIVALAELLSRTRNVGFARQRVQQFRLQTGREAEPSDPGNPFRAVGGEPESEKVERES